MKPELPAGGFPDKHEETGYLAWCDTQHKDEEAVQAPYDPDDWPASWQEADAYPEG